MRYSTDRSAMIISPEELCALAEGFYKPGVTSNESSRQKCRDMLAIEYGIFFSPDVTLDYTCSVGGINYELTARADGILVSDGKVHVFMIKCGRSKSSVVRFDPMFSSLSQCIAHFAASKYEAESVILHTVFFSIDSEKISEEEKEYSDAELQRAFLSKIFKIERFAKLHVNKELSARPSIAAMKFPYESIREGQKDLIEAVYKAIHRGKRLFAQAPTGIGKTVSVLYPSVKAIGEGLLDKIFYLTAKGSTKKEALSAARKMCAAGAELKAIILTSKEQSCSNSAAKLSGIRTSVFCSPGRCERLSGYSARVKEAIYELLTEESIYTYELIFEKANKYSICPYELSLDLSEYCDIIICDYNYVFDSGVSLRRYFGESSDKKDERYAFLIDEAHNLPDRAREMYSAELCTSDFERYLETLPEYCGKLEASFEEIIKAFRAMRRLCSDNLAKGSDGVERGFYFSTDPLRTFAEKLEKFIAALDAFAKRNAADSLIDELSDLISNIRAYLALLDFYDEAFRTYVMVNGKNITVKIYCIDPSNILDICMNRAESSVLFSATLTPLDYFADVLGGAKNSMKISLPSPFPIENLSISALVGLSTRQDDREKNISKVASAIAASVLPKKGNYIAYFPSYSYMSSVADFFAKKFPAVTLKVQSQNMSRVEKEHFLDFFKDDEDVLRIGFCVLGGSFSEGVDLPGKKLIGSIIVGVGLPGLSNDLNIIRDFYELKYERGYDYAYTFPGMNKILQASGRVIRTETDKGIVVLIDDRYGTPQYRTLFPEHWKNINFASSAAELAEIARHFWGNANNM